MVPFHSKQAVQVGKYLGSMPPSHPHRLVSRSPAPWLVLIVAVDRWFVRSLLALPRLWLLLLCVCVCVSDRWERRRQTRTRGFPRSPPAQVHRRHFDWESEILARNWQGSAAHPYISSLVGGGRRIRRTRGKEPDGAWRRQAGKGSGCSARGVAVLGFFVNHSVRSAGVS